MKIVTRFAPSPTGVLHLGGARTAIFNWLFARNNQGKFILRIEDTDRQRSSRESEQQILDSLEWLGLAWDETPERQSDRTTIYRKYADRLIEEGKAYRCYMSSADLQKKREEAEKKGEYFRYRREWAQKDASPDKPYAVRLATPSSGDVVVEDIVRGTVKFDSKEIDDFVILKTDGFPTYNFAVAVDDYEMGISHVIRGDDHLTNTSKQVLIYDSLALKKPLFAHVSMILGPDKAKLSKRHGATSVREYKNNGYLPEAVLNYLVRLGWSHGDQEIFTRDELISKFNLENVGKSPSVFNPQKFLWLNSWYIKNSPVERIADQLLPVLEQKGYKTGNSLNLFKIIEQLRERAETLNDIADQSHYFFSDDFEYEEKAAEKFLTADNEDVFKKVSKQLSSLEEFSHDGIHSAFGNVMNETGLKLGKIAQPVRVALTGGTKSPGIFDVIEILGKDRTLRRLDKAINLCSE